MAFILAAQRDNDCEVAFKKYREYLFSVSAQFPKNAWQLASSDWYFDFSDKRCPHDAWLDQLIIEEPSSGVRNEIRENSIRVRLLGAYHDGMIELRYRQVFAYAFEAADACRGVGDWRYDEFRLTPRGTLLHEIEWAGHDSTKHGARWLIEAGDVEYHWSPFHQSRLGLKVERD